MPEPQPFPWEAAMGFGLGRLRLPPAHFWQMTPLELAAAARALAPVLPATLDAATLAELSRRYPD
ncbi:MAG: phage tail assembly chaperone [Beijerinckiaceae bacterium]